MRKVLLLGAALLISAGIMAQSTVERTLVGASNKYKQVKKLERINNSNQQATKAVSRPAHNFQTKATQAITKTYIGTSANCFSVLLPEQTGLTANQATGLIMMTHRQDGVTLGSGYIQEAFSTDGGFSFDDSTATVWLGVTPNLARYPSGVIYNPSGNTTPSNAFAVSAGPLTNGSGWFGAYFSSIKLDGTLLDDQITQYTTDTAGGVGQLNDMPRYFMQSHGNKIFLYGDANTDDGTNYTSIHTTLNIGTFNTGTNSVDWVRVGVTPDYVNDGSGNPDGWAFPALVMDNDGVIGYLIYCGRNADATDPLSIQPVIYKTIDGGITWDKQVFNWESCAGTQSIVSDLSPVSRPLFFNAKDAVIDANGHLHFINYVYGAGSDNADSLWSYYYYSSTQGVIVDTYQTASGWSSVVVDTVFATDPDETTAIIDPGTADYVAWDERFQMSRTEDGSKIVYAWMDTDPNLTAVNLYPDIMVKMYDVATETMGPKLNITAGTEYDATNYWLYLSDITLDKGSYYQVCMSTSTLETNSNNPVDHEFINGVYLDESGNLVAGVSELSLDAAVSMYPNPTSGDLNISFNNLASGNYNVVVFNTIGSVVINQNMDVNGAVVRTINMNELPTGIYMVQVSSENGSVTKKVIKN